MSQIQTYVIISMFAAALIVAGIPILPAAHGSFCGGFPPVGLICAVLNISSVSITSNVRGTLYTGNTTHSGNSSIIALCTAAHPCIIAGTFNTRSGKIAFTSHPTIPTFVPVNQNYTGYLSQRVLFDVTEYTIDGIGITIKPVFGQVFGWDASMSCLVVGPCFGGSR